MAMTFDDVTEFWRFNQVAHLPQQYVSSEGDTALHTAFWQGNSFLVEEELNQLLEGDNPVNAWEMSALHIACAHGCDQHVCDFLDFNVVRINHCTLPNITPLYAGFNALHFASLFNRKSTVELLLERGADVKSRTAWGQTALHLACIYDDTSLVNLLLDKGADLEATDKNGLTPLLYTCISDLTSDADICMCKERENARTHNSLYSVLPKEKAFQYRCEIINCLLDRGALIYSENKKNILHNLVSISSTEKHVSTIVKMVEILVKRGADINAQDENLYTPLHHAAKSLNQDVFINTLIKCGADVNARGRAMNTPLHIAVHTSNHRIVEALLKHGADIFAQNFFKHTPYSEIEKWCAPYLKSVLEVLAIHAKRLVILGITMYGGVLRFLKEKLDYKKVHPIENECLEELERMKLVQVDDDTTLYRLIRTGRNAMGCSLDDDKLESIMKDFDIVNKYPHYANILTLQVKRGRLLEAAKETLKLLFRFELPLLISNQILKNMTDTDLRNLVEVKNVKIEETESASAETATKE